LKEIEREFEEEEDKSRNTVELKQVEQESRIMKKYV